MRQTVKQNLRETGFREGVASPASHTNVLRTKKQYYTLRYDNDLEGSIRGRMLKKKTQQLRNILPSTSEVRKNLSPNVSCNFLHVLAKPAIIYTTRTTPELSCVQKKYNIYKNVAEPPRRTVSRAARRPSLLLLTAQPNDVTHGTAQHNCRALGKCLSTAAPHGRPRRTMPHSRPQSSLTTQRRAVSPRSSRVALFRTTLSRYYGLDNSACIS